MFRSIPEDYPYQHPMLSKGTAQRSWISFIQLFEGELCELQVCFVCSNYTLRCMLNSHFAQEKLHCRHSTASKDMAQQMRLPFSCGGLWSLLFVCCMKRESPIESLLRLWGGARMSLYVTCVRKYSSCPLRHLVVILFGGFGTDCMSDCKRVEAVWLWACERMKLCVTFVKRYFICP